MNDQTIEKPFIKNPFLSDMIILFDSLRNKKRDFGIASCLLLTGESGSGKSALAKYYLKINPVVEEYERTYIPVLHFELKAISTPRELLISLLVAIGDPQQGMGARNQGELYERLVGLIDVTGLELLILDEIQVIIERRSAQVVTGIADLFKDLIKDTDIPIIFMGMPWSKYLVDSNQQLRRRIAYRHIIPPYKVSDKANRDNYRRLLKLLSDTYQFSVDLKLEELSFTYRIFAATSGNLANTASLISDVYVMSKMESKKASIHLFAEVMSSYGVVDDENPFLVSMDKLQLKELIVHSDWRFGNRVNKNSIIESEYITFGISLEGRIYNYTSVS